MTRTADPTVCSRPVLEVWSTADSSERGTAESIARRGEWDVRAVRSDADAIPVHPSCGPSAVILDLYAVPLIAGGDVLPTSEEWISAHRLSVAALSRCCFSLGEEVRNGSSLQSVVVMTPDAMSSDRVEIWAMGSAMEGLAAHLADEWRRFGVRVNVVRFPHAAAHGEENLAEGCGEHSLLFCKLGVASARW